MNRRYSLRSRALFARLYRDGRSIREGGLILRYLPESSGLPRFAFSAKRDVGTAVARNRLRRIFKEAVCSEICAWAPGLYHFRFSDGGFYLDRDGAVTALQKLRGLISG